MGLYYSGNGFDWHHAGMIDYHLSFGRHFTYPHMTIAGVRPAWTCSMHQRLLVSRSPALEQPRTSP